MKLREKLVGLRPQAIAYRESMGKISEEIDGIQGKIRSLSIFPIKALGGLNLMQARIGLKGLMTTDGALTDRMAMLVLKEKGKCDDGDYNFKRFSQREEPALALVVPSYEDGVISYSTLNQSAPSIEINVQDLVPKVGEEVEFKMFGNGGIFRGVLDQSQLTEWVRDLLRKNRRDPNYNINDVSVLFPAHDMVRQTEVLHDRGQNSQTVYSDGGQILVASYSTLDWMNQTLKPGMDLRAFRPNIGISGEIPANVEDIIDSIRIQGRNGEVKMLFGEMSVRCAVTQVEQDTGKKRPDKQPLGWLAKNRPPRPDILNSVTFGVNTVFPSTEAGKIISVGDKFIIDGEKLV